MNKQHVSLTPEMKKDPVMDCYIALFHAITDPTIINPNKKVDSRKYLKGLFDEEESQKMNILDELDKKPFAKTQKIELKENVEHELEPKKESNKIKYQSQMNQTLSFEDQLRKFYDKYHERDNKFLEEPLPEYYSVEIL